MRVEVMNADYCAQVPKVHATSLAGI
jgi:hypothetical protein